MMHATESLSVPATVPGVRQAIVAFERFGRSHKVPAGSEWRVLLALDEILSNIVRHTSEEHAIDMTFSVDGDIVGVEIVDSTAAFNPLLAPPPDTTSPLAERRPGGLGIALVRKLMDETYYERRNNRNHFVMRCRPRADH
ncbi:MAG TPA: ATP-binding protein [Vicinamibacterales bacterium]|nr:ATP-binding protein [Vicinamibacterales bacterium]